MLLEDIKPPEPTSSDESVVAVYIEDLPQHIPPHVPAPEKTRQDPAGTEREEESFISHVGWVGKCLTSLMMAVAAMTATPQPHQESEASTTLVLKDTEMAGYSPPANAGNFLRLVPLEVNPEPKKNTLLPHDLVGLLMASEQLVPELIVYDMVKSGPYTLPPQQWLDIVDIIRSFLNGFREGLPSAEELGKQLAQRLVEKGIDHSIELGAALATAIIAKVASSSSSSKGVSTVSLREKK